VRAAVIVSFSHDKLTISQATITVVGGPMVIRHTGNAAAIVLKLASASLKLF
jgi:hypothetical protein